MRYIEVEWIHGNSDYPVRLISEINDDRYEVRKIEIYLSGKIGFATAQIEQGNTRLGTAPIPSLDSINADKEFIGKEIDRATFELNWQQIPAHQM